VKKRASLRILFSDRTLKATVGYRRMSETERSCTSL